MPPELAALVAGAINLRAITDHWSELLRLATSIFAHGVAPMCYTISTL
ncbi:Tn3 family transposase [Nitrosovibrio sp. Nv6]|nr:Tn3 family transposase [Nitrosovibrio sp. Nv6]